MITFTILATIITIILVIIGLLSGLVLLPIIDVLVCGMIIAIMYRIHKHIQQNDDKGDSQ